MFILLVLSTLQAKFPGEAALQLLNFLPYFLVWSAIATFIAQHQSPWRFLERLAWVLTIGSMPFCVLAGLEHVLKQSSAALFPQLLQTLPLLDWFYTGLPTDPRAYGVFDSPNTLANYAVMVLGLALGLLVRVLVVDPQASTVHRPYPVLGISMLSLLMVLYVSGSRNGYLVAVVLLLGSLLTFKVHSWIRWAGLGLLGAIAASALTFGIGGRQISWAWVTQDPRVDVWRLALRLTRESPWLGHGLGNYKLLYDGSVPGYDAMPHAHNLWLSLSAEAGVPVMVGFTLVIGLICYQGVRLWQQMTQAPEQQALLTGYLISFFAATVFALFDVTLYDSRLNLLAWLTLATMYGLASRPNDSRPEKSA
ncbi:MAG: O-antigen ligase family protein [Leptolyngbyaceae cyanobacterium]